MANHINLSLYNKNLSALLDKYPDIHESVCASDDKRYRTTSGEKDTYNLIYDGTTPPTYFYDSEDPFGFSRRLLKPYIETNSKFFVLLGMGLGYSASQLIETKQLAKLIIVEKDIACFKRAMECFDLTDIIKNPSVAIVAGCNEIDLFIAMRKAMKPHFTGSKDIIFVPLPAAVAISESYYSKVVSTVRDVIELFLNDRGNDPYDTLVGYEQFFNNINDYFRHPGGSHVKDIFKSKPAIVVATGPSLKKNIHFLKEVEDSAVIVSADASLRILHEHDIFPHMVTTVERPPGFDVHYRDLNNLDKTVLATISFVHPSTLRAYNGPKIFFHRIYDFMLKFGLQEDCISLGASTANMAFEVALHMGCNPIILIGNDLSFDKSGQTHADGFLHGEKYSYYDNVDRFEVPGNYEETVTTCEAWFTCIKDYERRIHDWTGTLINATDGGARIRGSKVVPLREAIQSYCKSPFYPREILSKQISRWQNQRTVESFTSTINRFIETVDKFLDISKKLHIILGGIIKDIKKSDKYLCPALKRQLHDSIPHINAALDSLLNSPLTENFGEYIYTDLLPLLMEWQVIDIRFSEPAWADAYRVKLADDYFASLGQLCISLKEILMDGKKRLASL